VCQLPQEISFRRRKLANFNEAIGIVLDNEGGYINDKNDTGGETKYGISKRSYPNVDIKNLTEEEAIAIYLRDFWKFDGLINQAVANKVFDSYVNIKHTAVKYMQEIVLKATQPDGEYGPVTEDAINRYEPNDFLNSLRARLVQHYKDFVEANPGEAKDLNGLLKRARQ
jgi:lysozyme family protein